MDDAYLTLGENHCNDDQLEDDEEDLHPLLLRLQSNDPSLTELELAIRGDNYDDGDEFYEDCRDAPDSPNTYYIDDICDPHSLAFWDELGRHVGCNAHLKTLNIYFEHYRTGSENVDAFFGSLKSNRSITSLLFDSYQWHCSHIQSLASFFENIHNLDSVRVEDCGFDSHTFLALLRRTHSHLRSLEITHGDGFHLDKLLVPFHRKSELTVPQLEHLVLNEDAIRSGELNVLATLMQHPDSKLKELHLDLCHVQFREAEVVDFVNQKFGKAEVVDFLNSLAHCQLRLRILDLRKDCYDGLDRDMFEAIGALLQNSNSELEELRLLRMRFDERGLVDLVRFLANSHVHVKMNGLNVDGDIGILGCEALASLLRNPKFELKRSLSLLQARIEDGDLADLLNSLVNCSHRLFSLTLCGVTNFGRRGCEALGGLLRNPTLDLVELCVASNEIGDDEVCTIFNPLADGHLNLRSLYLGGNNDIGIIGYRTLAALLGNQNSMLEALDLRGNNIGDDEVSILASALASNPNSKLHTLDTYGNLDITSEGWRTFSRLLCNTSSINHTYLSNHALNDLGFEQLPSDLSRVLNYNKDKQFVARQKVLNVHFKGDDYIMEPFATMEREERSVLPYILAFMSKAHRNTDGHSALYHFLKRMPSIFYADPNVAKSEMKGPRRM